MTFRTVAAGGGVAALCLSLLTGAPALASDSSSAPMTAPITVATFNASLNRSREGELLEHLANGDNVQAQNAAETIQRINADIILINEFDYDTEHKAADLFRKNYLEVGHNGAQPITYPYMWTGPVNTGVPSGFDLDNDGQIKPGNDAWGFGMFPGQYGFVVYSKYPIKAEQVRTFQNFLWKDMPGAALPVNADGSSWYSVEELAKFPLSSKTHADIPVDVNGTIVHVLAAHPTPPAFDGPEMRNQKRNHDEIRMWADYISGAGTYLYDDKGGTGTLAQDANFVILGDYNADPSDGNSYQHAIMQLLGNPRVLDTLPTSEGGPQEQALQGEANATHKGDPKYDTADFSDGRTGNLRVDYVLPNRGVFVEEARVFWPTREDELFRLTGLDKNPQTGERQPFPTSDHRAVWVRMRFPASADQTVPPTTSPTPPTPPAPTTPPAPPVAPGQPTPPVQPTPPATVVPPKADDAASSKTKTPSAPQGKTADAPSKKTSEKLAATGASGLTWVLLGGGVLVLVGVLLVFLKRRGQ
ncbi:endonuclease/exonuclease/phosphatase family protein [Schaalia sp. Marseille-Q2122]|uniref:endonuclease/exonuclease/phosphatase family protein n=1 Tax=Schaalia sp. Marseille-Q2122 TaxID=2736604 RepID=UPI00158A034C|nr:endonuclease/exonuclease/phosphatase family protein [Schaalia sp. Marseille-Q2122]